MCVIGTQALLGLGVYFFVYRLGLTWAKTCWIIYWPVFDILWRLLMASWCHLYCVFADPGYTMPCANNGCKKCGCERPSRTHHCSQCGRCVERMDHHCPWIGNCVGKGTQKSFLLFLAYTASAGIEGVIFVCVRFLSCPTNTFVLLGLRLVIGEERVVQLLIDEQSEANFEGGCELTIEYATVGAVTFVCAIVFVVFTSFIAVDQLQNILSNRSTVEILKGETWPKRSIQTACIEVMGSEPSIAWLLPYYPLSATGYADDEKPIKETEFFDVCECFDTRANSHTMVE